jgi:hypothetical protein
MRARKRQIPRSGTSFWNFVLELRSGTSFWNFVLELRSGTSFLSLDLPSGLIYTIKTYFKGRR